MPQIVLCVLLRADVQHINDPSLPYISTRLVEKARSRQQAVDDASNSVTSHIFHLQSELRKRFLEQISKASMHERDNLRQWRRVIQLNTHPRSDICWPCTSYVYYIFVYV